MDDFDSFIDFNGGVDSSNYAPEDPQPFSGPSFEYDRFRQQTGFPTGSMSNVAAYNDMNMDGLDMSSTANFNNYNPSNPFAMDFESTTQGPAYFFPQNKRTANDEFVDPTAVYGKVAGPVRMWPGMHSQQAEQARNMAMAKQNQQQHMSSRHQLESAQSVAQGKKRAGSQMPDALAERKISDILENMRHKSTVSVMEEEDDADGDLSKSRKDEEDMDEDERLLASEEGKKLSSKERRQLRNKVSARAFRSRRKEYISQLEGDLATKVSESNDLKLVNRKLLEENNQLKNLTRTLLSHPAFQTFLEDMSRSQTFVPPPQNMLAPTDSTQVNTQSGDVKQESEQQSQDDTHVHAAQVPQDSLNLSMLNLGNNHWNMQSSTFNYQQPQVFALFELPAGPSLEELVSPAVLSGKPSLLENFEAAPVMDQAVKNLPAPIEFPNSISKDLKLSPSRHYSCSSSKPSSIASQFPASFASSSSTASPASIESVHALFVAIEPLQRRVDELTAHIC